ncbi:MAG TPA: Ig-like domain-containing protein [Gemmatimonadota bacterium]|nr:Ig-like domain-containing protein [Gemmatimonadota bacterium]
MKKTLRLACLALLVAMEGVACDGGSHAPTGPLDCTSPDCSKVVSLEIVAPRSLLVNEAALFTVRARNADGVVVRTPPELQWASSDEAIARVEATGAGSGVVTARRRGTVMINVSAGNVDASVSLSVKARVIIRLTPPDLEASVAIGEALQFEAFFVDVNGATIDETPSVDAWTSSDPDVADVNSIGNVIGLRTGHATITAWNSDGRATMDVTVTDVIARLPAKVRFAHAADGRGPVTFVPSQGAPVTLAFGESVEVPIVSGPFGVHVDGLGTDGSDQSWVIRGGDHLALYGTGVGTAGLWISEVSVPADSGLVRFLEGSPSNWGFTLFLGAPGAEVVESRLINCYFDPGHSTEYVRVPAGAFDVIGGGKDLLVNPSAVDITRVRSSAMSGRAVTYVLAGDSPQTARVLAFPDF